MTNQHHTTNRANSIPPTDTADVVIVGAGIVGGALATVLADAGLDVCVLERAEWFRDHNKGETMVPWGWADADHLGLAPILDAAAGYPNPVWDVVDPDGATRAVPVAQLRPDAPGTYSVSHPAACAALTEAARHRGADVRFGATGLRVTPGPTPTVTWQESGVDRRVRARLVVGADGRGSSVRRQLDLELHRTERTHLISSVLVEGTRDLDDHLCVVGGDEKLLLVIPLAQQRARLYLVSRDQRFGGKEDAERLVQATKLPAAPEPERWTTVPAGPCATFGGEDAWVDRPVAEGCVLIGDAAGYNSPIIGQGLSLAMRDVRLVSDAILGADRWTTTMFDHYVEERAERLRRVRFIAQLWAQTRLVPDEQLLRLREQPLLQPILLGIFTGFDDADPELFTPETARTLLAGIGAAEPTASLATPAA